MNIRLDTPDDCTNGTLCQHLSLGTIVIYFKAVGERIGYPVSKGFQVAQLCRLKHARLMTNYAQGAQMKFAVQRDGGTCIGANAVGSGNIWIIAKAFVLSGIFNHHGFTRSDNVGTKGHFAWGFRFVQAHSRFEPLALIIDQAYERGIGVQ